MRQELGSDSIAVDYWLDSAHLLRQLHLAITMPRQPSPTPSEPAGTTVIPMPHPITIAITLQLSHYGIAVHVVPPPADQITSHESCVSSSTGFSCN